MLAACSSSTPVTDDGGSSAENDLSVVDLANPNIHHDVLVTNLAVAATSDGATFTFVVDNQTQKSISRLANLIITPLGATGLSCHSPPWTVRSGLTSATLNVTMSSTGVTTPCDDMMAGGTAHSNLKAMLPRGEVGITLNGLLNDGTSFVASATTTY